jgi:alpha-D-xyloside xylohydrolase
MLTEGVALGGAACCSGAPNEVWSYGEDVYEVCKKYMAIRENMRDYTRQLMRDAHEKGTPIMRPCFYDFPEDERCWDIEEEYMYGEKYLCCPVFKLGQRKIKVYLPRGATWDSWLGEASYQGGQMIEVECPLDTMPVFVRH